MEITNISCPIQLLWNWQYGRTRKHLTFLLVWTFLLTSLLFESCFGHKYVPEFNDKLAFEIAWRGAQEKDLHLLDRETIIINTLEKEKYKCYLPQLNSDDNLDGKSQSGLPAEKLLEDILTQKTKCSYRLEPYWTYEVCHGLHVRQFHEEKSFGPEKIKLQEYYLGRAYTDTDTSSKQKEESEKNQETESNKEVKVKTRLIDGRETPYYNVSMANGTPCDISNNKPRQVDIMYICHPTANNEVISVKEVTSCEYEVMVLTPELCRNPAYVGKDDPLRAISCLPLFNSPSRPKSLDEHDALALEERAVVKTSHLSSGTQSGQVIEPIIASEPAGVSPPVPAQEPTGESPPEESQEPESRAVSDEHRKLVTSPDTQLTKDFLYGEYCLQGGSGYWLFEFCNKKHILQFHQETAQSRSLIYLGFWNKEKHLEWIKGKRNLMSNNHVTHFYSGGDVCDVTGKQRHTQVKLKCMEGKTGQQISIYMIEPSPCEYIVGIESPILCPFIANADMNGLFVDV